PSTPTRTLFPYTTLFRSQSEKTHNSPSTPLYLYSNYHLSDKFSVGLSVFTPYGSAVEYTTDWPGSHLVNRIELSAFYIQPHVARSEEHTSELQSRFDLVC